MVLLFSLYRRCSHPDSHTLLTVKGCPVPILHIVRQVNLPSSVVNFLILLWPARTPPSDVFRDNNSRTAGQGG